MAKITGQTDERIFQIKEWQGLNENPDGDTKLKMGEAAVIRNFKVTRAGNLQRRPGSYMVKGLLKSYILTEDEAADFDLREEMYRDIEAHRSEYFPE